MKIIIATDSFKGSLSSEEAARLCERAAKRVFPGCRTVTVPAADGGEGTVRAVIGALGGDIVKARAHDPLMREIESFYGRVADGGALVECAAVSGLTLLAPGERIPARTTSYGTGELIRAALDAGCRKVTVALGGSATNDGGMGALRALGVRFYDARGEELSGCGADLARVARIDAGGLCPAARDASFTVMCDVRNPLTGADGATYIFGPQKGGTKDELDELEKGMINYADVVRRVTGADLASLEGAGAAGGLGGALFAFLGAEMKSGIECVLDIVHFDELLCGADLVVTGEGRLDGQSAEGKVVSGVARRAAERGVPVIAVAGSMGPGAETVYDCGVGSVATSVNAPMSESEALAHARELYESAAERAFRMIRIGRGMRGQGEA